MKNKTKISSGSFPQNFSPKRTLSAHYTVYVYNSIVKLGAAIITWKRLKWLSFTYTEPIKSFFFKFNDLVFCSCSWVCTLLSLMHFYRNNFSAWGCASALSVGEKRKSFYITSRHFFTYSEEALAKLYIVLFIKTHKVS